MAIYKLKKCRCGTLSHWSPCKDCQEKERLKVKRLCKTLKAEIEELKTENQRLKDDLSMVDRGTP